MRLLVWGGTASTWYLIVFWIEVVVITVLAIWACKRKRTDLVAPLVLAVVGIHVIPLAWVFQQPVYAYAGSLMAIAALAIRGRGASAPIPHFP